MPWAIFSDFDGTLTDKDTIDTLVEAFLGTAYCRDVVARLTAGTSTVRQVISEEFARLRLTPAAMEAFLQGEIRVDPELPALLREAEAQFIPFEILSSGMDALIHPLLRAAGIDVPVRCNQLFYDADAEPCYRIVYRDDSANGHDKACVLRRAKAQGLNVIYLGDGITDLACAREADVLFARRQLASYCRTHQIRFHELQSCADVRRFLSMLPVLETARDAAGVR
ncbi:MAG: HAD-IB family phosphatase [Terriglobales bacterium]